MHQMKAAQTALGFADRGQLGFARVTHADTQNPAPAVYQQANFPSNLEREFGHSAGQFTGNHASRGHFTAVQIAEQFGLACFEAV